MCSSRSLSRCFLSDPVIFLFLRHYDGEDGQHRCNIDPFLIYLLSDCVIPPILTALIDNHVLQTKANQYRAEELSYIVFHDLNETNPLLDSLEKFKHPDVQKLAFKLHFCILQKFESCSYVYSRR